MHARYAPALGEAHAFLWRHVCIYITCMDEWMDGCMDDGGSCVCPRLVRRQKYSRVLVMLKGLLCLRGTEVEALSVSARQA
jgi:hypothetical protein